MGGKTLRELNAELAQLEIAIRLARDRESQKARRSGEEGPGPTRQIATAIWSDRVANTIAGGAATTTLDGKRWTQFEISDIYALSKSTQLYANVLYERGTGGANAALFTAGPSSNANQVALMVGVHHLFQP